MDYKVTAPVTTEWRTPPRVCRCCLSEGCYKDISSEYYWMGEKEIYAEMLKECFDLTISTQDVGSNGCLICEVCITRLRDASNFKKQVVSSEKRFLEHVKSGTALSEISGSQDKPSFQEIKIESIKEETVISDDDPPDPNDVDFDDDDYDESDSLPLKFEAQKKEALAELSFGDEIPILSNAETTIKKVSGRSKESKVLKKLKLNKKELTIKPVKASGSKAKTPREPKVKVKPAKIAKKGPETEWVPAVNTKVDSIQTDETLARNSIKLVIPYENIKSKIDTLRRNVGVILKSFTVCPFKWQYSKYLCFYCSSQFLEPESMRAHTLSHKADSFPIKNLGNTSVKIDVTDAQCRICNTAVDNIAYITHLNLHGVTVDSTYGDGLMPFKLGLGEEIACLICDQRFASFYPLSNHMNQHYQDYQCGDCDKAFATQQRLKSHSRTHQIKQFKCLQCDLSFPSYKAHFAHTTNIHYVKRNKCTHCEMRFRSYHERQKHMRDAHNEKVPLHACPSCPRIFTLCSQRNEHVKLVHLRQKNVLCPVCGMKFLKGSDLREHAVKHGGERIYQCDICKKSYARMKTLREHMRIHNNDRRFSCSTCGQAFVQNCSLKQHVKVYHPEIAHVKIIK